MPREDQILRIASIAGILVVLAIVGAFVKIYFLDRFTVEPAPAAPAPPPPPPPPATVPDEPAPDPVTVDTAEVERSIDRAVARLNIMGIVANVMDLRGRAGDAAVLRNAMSGFEPGLAGLAALRGPGTLVPERLAARDVIVRFRTFTLADFDKPDAEKFLTDFLKHLRVGSRARVETKRGSQQASIEIAIRALPDDWPELVAPALASESAAIEAAAPPSGEPRTLTPEQTDALAILLSPDRRTRGDDRLQAIYELSRLSERSGMSGGFYAAARLFLERGSSDPAVAEYFQVHRIGAVETFTIAQHLAAAQWLADRRRSARDPEALLLFAAGHLGDAWRRQAGADPAFARTMTALGMMRADQPFGCGRPVDVAAIAIAGTIRAGAPQRGIDALGTRFKGHSDPALQALRGYAELLVTKDPRRLQERLALLARACPRPDDAAFLNRLAEAAGDVAAGKSVDQALARAPCSRCRERGSLIPGAAWRCDLCNGLGFTLARP